MKKHFIHSENGSEIFWQIEISGLSLILSFGKIGNSIGKRSIRNFKTREECFKEFQKLIDQKSILGFKESDRVPPFKALSGNADYLTTWNAVLEAPDRKKALRSHFEILTETEQCAEILDEIVSKIEEIYIENDQFVFTLPWHYDEETKVHIRWNAPYIGRIHSSVPHSMAKFVTNFNGVSFHHDNDDFATLYVEGIRVYGKKTARVARDGGWEEEILEEGDDWWIAPLEILEQDFEDVQCFGAFDEGQNWFVFHPVVKNRFGELAITTVSHESCEMDEAVVRYGMGGFILREIASWILDIEIDSGKDLSLSGHPVVTRTFQEFVAHKAVELSENHPEVAKRLLEYDWHTLADSIHKTISEWVRSLAKEVAVEKDILVIDSYWDDAGEVIFLGLDWHSGVDYKDAISEGANEIDYPLDFTSFYKSVLGKNQNEDLDGSEVVEILEDDYSITRDILAYLSIQNLVSVSNGEDFQKLPLDEKGIYIAYSHYHDEEVEVAYHSTEGIKKEFFKSLFSTEGKNKKEREVPEEEQELIDDIVGDVMENYPWIWKDTIEKSMNRLAENFQENKERYQREFNKILEYKEKVDEEEKTALSDLGMQMSSAALNRFLRENKPDAAKWVLDCYSNIYRSLEINGNSTLTGNETGNSYNTAEYFAGDIIVFITKYNESQYLALLEDLLPADIQDARLAFNLACLNSLEKNKENVLRYTKLALSLGKPKKDFEDSDFDNFKDDPEFHSLVVLH
ncbi:TPR end-of-group domain-containing protein [Leptospira borgpetersenii]|uniref:TPR end-of-group domain-containing protein n=1 Tax=Leptospira borgpetersenii TaxID=174 RepID=UPI0007733896|nr:WGR domain-containing protein [Leptospira borgpetersenii]MBE8399900.1 WGR domain-containing protein [Leptospira borgpetersenii serovar Tarassovi]MBE8401970.1 WGR domain-containing protein [Leptospira borgpetersenii serovar Tarassovi]MBE8406818.1 WGR domain-containing protein [Leptospira borgpetersenii serovar Tarassovi]MBE8413098.1 WGR domain-containing protein [Leptospira borgpetersenii serovar Tarassovi]MBE8415115.1 WGR domain-containing protein [Leptospira borgpetersenii serovar Tarassov